MTQSVTHPAAKYLNNGCEPWCNNHQQADLDLGLTTGFCRHTRRTELVDVDVYLDEGRLVVEPYIRNGTRMNAAQATEVAKALSGASAVVDSAALPGSDLRQAVHVEHAALLAGVPTTEALAAFARGEFDAYPALDGSERLVVAFDEARAWAQARTVGVGA